MLGDHNLLVKGAFFYDACTKVPLIVRWPQSQHGQRASALVQPHDLAATILNAAGMSPEDTQASMPDSKNFAPLLYGETHSLHDSVVCCYRNTGISDQGVYWNPPIHATMLRDERYKLNMYHADPHSPIEGELYDMQTDPQELRDLWNRPDYGDVRKHMTELLMDWLFQQELSKGSRGGEALPDQSQQLVNALK
jgi:arylsulfatase A-like enzyme